MNLLEQLTKLASYLDAKGLHTEADLVDQIMVEAAGMDPMATLKAKQMKDPTSGAMVPAYQYLKNQGLKDAEMSAMTSKLYGAAKPETWNMDNLVKHIQEQSMAKKLMSPQDKLKTAPVKDLKPTP